MKLKKGSYYNRNDFVKHVCTIVLGRYLYDETTEISFQEIADYLNTTTENLRMKKSNKQFIALLKEQGIKIEKKNNLNHFVLEAEQFYLVIEDDDENNNNNNNNNIVI